MIVCWSNVFKVVMVQLRQWKIILKMLPSLRWMTNEWLSFDNVINSSEPFGLRMKTCVQETLQRAAREGRSDIGGGCERVPRETKKDDPWIEEVMECAWRTGRMGKNYLFKLSVFVFYFYTSGHENSWIHTLSTCVTVFTELEFKPDQAEWLLMG